MPRFTILAEAYLRFETEASSPDEAKQMWRRWLQDRRELRLDQNLRITLRFPEIAVVLAEEGEGHQPHMDPRSLHEG